MTKDPRPASGRKEQYSAVWCEVHGRSLWGICLGTPPKVPSLWGTLNLIRNRGAFSTLLCVLATSNQHASACICELKCGGMNWGPWWCCPSARGGKDHFFTLFSRWKFGLLGPWWRLAQAVDDFWRVFVWKSGLTPTTVNTYPVLLPCFGGYPLLLYRFRSVFFFWVFF